MTDVKDEFAIDVPCRNESIDNSDCDSLNDLPNKDFVLSDTNMNTNSFFDQVLDISCFIPMSNDGVDKLETEVDRGVCLDLNCTEYLDLSDVFEKNGRPEETSRHFGAIENELTTLDDFFEIEMLENVKLSATIDACTGKKECLEDISTKNDIVSEQNHAFKAKDDEAESNTSEMEQLCRPISITTSKYFDGETNDGEVDVDQDATLPFVVDLNSEEAVNSYVSQASVIVKIVQKRGRNRKKSALRCRQTPKKVQQTLAIKHQLDYSAVKVTNVACSDEDLETVSKNSQANKIEVDEQGNDQSKFDYMEECTTMESIPSVSASCILADNSVIEEDTIEEGTIMESIPSVSASCILADNSVIEEDTIEEGTIMESIPSVSASCILADNSVIEDTIEEGTIMESIPSVSASCILADNSVIEEIKDNVTNETKGAQGVQKQSRSYHKRHRALMSSEMPLSKEDSERFREPFKFGWRRELVIRKIMESDEMHQCDVYYLPPSGTKIRSNVQLHNWISTNSTSLTTENFTFMRRAIGMESAEIVRHAGASRGRVSMKNKLKEANKSQVFGDAGGRIVKPVIMIERVSNKFLHPIKPALIATDVSRPTLSAITGVPLQKIPAKRGRKPKTRPLVCENIDNHENEISDKFLHPMKSVVKAKDVLGTNYTGPPALSAKTGMSPQKKPAKRGRKRQIRPLVCENIDNHENDISDKFLHPMKSVVKAKDVLGTNYTGPPALSAKTGMSPQKKPAKRGRKRQIRPLVCENIDNHENDISDKFLHPMKSVVKAKDVLGTNYTGLPALSAKTGMSPQKKPAKRGRKRKIRPLVCEKDDPENVQEKEKDDKEELMPVCIEAVIESPSNNNENALKTMASQKHFEKHTNVENGCSVTCPEMKHMPQMLHCNVCRRWFHNKCDNFFGLDDFVCLRCKSASSSPSEKLITKKGKEGHITTISTPVLLNDIANDARQTSSVQRLATNLYPCSLSQSLLFASYTPVTQEFKMAHCEQGKSTFVSPSLSSPLMTSTPMCISPGNRNHKLPQKRSTTSRSYTDSSPATEEPLNDSHVTTNNYKGQGSAEALENDVTKSNQVPDLSSLLNFVPMFLSPPVKMSNVNMTGNQTFQSTQTLQNPVAHMQYSHNLGYTIVPIPCLPMPGQDDVCSESTSSALSDINSVGKEKVNSYVIQNPRKDFIKNKRLNSWEKEQKEHWLCEQVLGGSKYMFCIFSYLGLKDLLRARVVCRSWSMLTMLPALWKHVSFNGVSLSNWQKAMQFLNRQHVQSVSFAGLLHFNDPNRALIQLVSVIQNLSSLQRISFGMVPFCVVHAVCDTLTELKSFTAENMIDSSHMNLSSVPTKLDIGVFSSLSHLEELRLKDTGGISLLDGVNLPNIGFLKVLRLTNLKNVSANDFSFIFKLVNVVELALGDCESWTKETYSHLQSLSSLEILQLENGGTIPDNGLGQALEHLPRLKTLELCNYTIADTFSAHIGKSTSLMMFVIRPDNTRYPEDVNTNVLLAIAKLSGKLKYLNWFIPSSSTTSIILDDNENLKRSSTEQNQPRIPFRCTTESNVNASLLSVMSGSNVCESLSVQQLTEKLEKMLPNTEINVYYEKKNVQRV